MTERVRALRGATTLETDTKDQVVDRTAELLGEMMARNDVAKDQIVSIIFTATPDITSEFPAAAGRKVGLSDIPLLCTQELAIVGDDVIGLVVRVLMHLYTEQDYGTLRHVYLHDARALRTDLRR